MQGFLYDIVVTCRDGCEFMKKLCVLFLLGLFVAFSCCDAQVEAKKSKKKGGGIAQEQLDSMSKTVDVLTKKMYSNALFSPEDNSNLIDIKIKLDNQMLVAPDVTLAPLYYKVGLIYKAREMNQESIESFQTILENFAETPLAPKAVAQLNSMGIKVKLPEKKEESE